MASLDEAIPGSIRDLPASAIREVANAGIGRTDLIPLWFGEGDLATPEFVRSAAIRSLEAGETFYEPNRGIAELRAALGVYLTGLYGRTFRAAHVTVTGSGLNGLMIAAQTVLEPGAHVVATVPVWPNLIAIPTILRARITPVPLEPHEAAWRLDLDRLIDACTPGTRLLLINTPSNPTGWMMDEAEIRTVLDFARARGIWVIADEVYARIVYDRAVAPSFLSLMEEDDRLIVVNSFSKSWCMTGWRLGWLTAPPALGPTFEKLMEFNTSCAPRFVQHGGLAALARGEGFIHEIRQRYGRSRDLMIERLGASNRITLPVPEAAFYGFFKVQGIEDGIAFAKRLVAEAGVGLAPGEAFGEQSRGWLRLCYATSPALLDRALDRLQEHLD
ncbi:MAG TPA: pyridoxal phosphate-dependent aminotransferase [Geminicoccaceae bacterium]